MAAKTIEERIVLIDEKIAKKEAELQELKEKKEKLLHPISLKAVISKAKESGMTAEEIAEKLGIEV